MEKRLLLLGLLREQEMHGYRLFEFIERDMAACIDIKKPTAYYLLNRMAEDGWITEQEIQDGNRPPRRVFSLTAQGEAEFQRLLRENLSSFEPAYFPGDVGLAFLDSLEQEEALALLERRRSVLVAILASVQTVPQHQGSLQLVIEHRIHHLTSELAWLDQLVVRFKTKSVNV